MRIEITGGYSLRGHIAIDGFKHSSLSILGASILANDEVTLLNVPTILDVSYLLAWMSRFCSGIYLKGNRVVIRPEESATDEVILPSYFTTKLHSAYALWPGLALRFHSFKSGVPGGCRIGARPLQEILGIMNAFGVDTTINQDMISFKLRNLVSPRTLDLRRYPIKAVSSATKIALLMAARLDDTTEIEGAFNGPEIADLASFLVLLGATVQGIGTQRLEVVGRHHLGGARFAIRPDSIEAVTYIAMAAATRGEITLVGLQKEDLRAELNCFQEMGITFDDTSSGLRVKVPLELKPVSVPFTHYPGFRTDNLPCLVAALTTANGVSVVRETVWEDRFAYVGELCKFGAKIEIADNVLNIEGPSTLRGVEVSATDLRCVAALVTAGLAAQRRTCIHSAHYVMRGYSSFVQKLSALGADLVVSD